MLIEIKIKSFGQIKETTNRETCKTGKSPKSRTLGFNNQEDFSNSTKKNTKRTCDQDILKYTKGLNFQYPLY